MDILVIGCGVSGLTSGLRLLEAGHSVTIWAKDRLLTSCVESFLNSKGNCHLCGQTAISLAPQAESLVRPSNDM